MKTKIYENFKDKFGNVYKFSNYLDFAKFWFSTSRRTNLNYFPENFKKLQAAATTSKEAKTPFYNQTTLEKTQDCRLV